MQGIQHDPSEEKILVLGDDIFEIIFTVTSSDRNQFAIFVNDVLVPGSIYGTDIARGTNTGMAIMPLVNGDIITIKNFDSQGTVFLNGNVGGSENNTNASITIKRAL